MIHHSSYSAHRTNIEITNITKALNFNYTCTATLLTDLESTKTKSVHYELRVSGIPSLKHYILVDCEAKYAILFLFDLCNF